MYNKDAVQLRSALSAAAVCAVLALAASSGGPRAGLHAVAVAPESGPILVKSIATIRKPGIANSRVRPEGVVAALAEARPRSGLVMRDGEQ